MPTKSESYAEQIASEKARYKDVANVHDLPEIFHYWSGTHLKPIFDECGIASIDSFFATTLHRAAAGNSSTAPRFASIGAGNLDTEIRVAKLLCELGVRNFQIECVELNPAMLARGVAQAQEEGVSEFIKPVEGDFNFWTASQKFDGVMANHSLHHVMRLEHLFREIKRSLKPKGLFVTSDMIGRNGHQRWPEALDLVHEFWKELPQPYRYNRLLQRHEEIYENWDCSGEGFEGIRAQDILPLLLRNFYFHLFIGFANVVSIFVDRGFGHNFDRSAAWDRAFIDRLHACDEAGFKTGRLKPTQMLAVMGLERPGKPIYSRGLSPKQSVRRPRRLDDLWRWVHEGKA